ncbi:MAG: phage major capsid protein [bacterium]|nr:phage major capsid protein [bacterium]
MTHSDQRLLRTDPATLSPEQLARQRWLRQPVESYRGPARALRQGADDTCVDIEEWIADRLSRALSRSVARSIEAIGI